VSIPAAEEAVPGQQAAEVSLQDLANQGLFLCGDGITDGIRACCGVEAAFLSGINAAGRVLGGLRREQKIQRGLW
jgi:predicted NAD/FAD-dependent oxidoreductase